MLYPSFKTRFDTRLLARIKHRTRKMTKQHFDSSVAPTPDSVTSHTGVLTRVSVVQSAANSDLFVLEIGHYEFLLRNILICIKVQGLTTLDPIRTCPASTALALTFVKPSSVP